MTPRSSAWGIIPSAGPRFTSPRSSEFNPLNGVAFGSAGRGRRTPSRTQSGLIRFGSARARACRELAHDLTFITTGLEKVSIYTTQISFSYPMWD